MHAMMTLRLPNRPAVLAHRGSGKPENSLAAFRRALAAGADGVELDVRSTADGALVLSHDASLPGGALIGESTTTGSEAVASLTRLEEALQACRGAWLDVEVKHDPATDPSRLNARRTAKLLQHHRHRVLVTSFDPDSIGFALRAGLPAGLLAETGEAQAATIARARDLGCIAVLPHVSMVEPGAVPKGLWVIAWTVNEVADLERLRPLTAVITDRVDTAVTTYGQ